MAGKIVIGLTGNIAAGKSLVLRMLQELGATPIDADKLAHLVMQKGTPVHQAIVAEFGKVVLDKEGEINRQVMGKIVFSSPEALKRLDAITHPAVRQEIKKQIAAAKTQVVAIEAVKLFESGAAEECHAKWLIVARPDVQLKRLVERRHMAADQAKLRLKAQPPAEQLVSKADVVIDNSGELAKTWAVVKKHFTALMQAKTGVAKLTVTDAEAPDTTVAKATTQVKANEVIVRRAKRSDLNAMCQLVSSATKGGLTPSADEIMESFLTRAYLVAESGKDIVGMAAWQTENLVAGLIDFYILRNELWAEVGKKMLDIIHEEVDKLSCEVSLVFILNKAGDAPIKFFEAQGYQQTESKKLGYIWKDAAAEWQPKDSVLMYKKIREKRIMVPM